MPRQYIETAEAREILAHEAVQQCVVLIGSRIPPQALSFILHPNLHPNHAAHATFMFSYLMLIYCQSLWLDLQCYSLWTCHSASCNPWFCITCAPLPIQQDGKIPHALSVLRYLACSSYYADTALTRLGKAFSIPRSCPHGSYRSSPCASLIGHRIVSKHLSGYQHRGVWWGIMRSPCLLRIEEPFSSRYSFLLHPVPHLIPDIVYQNYEPRRQPIW